MPNLSMNIIRGPLLIPIGIPTQVFFSDTRYQKRSLASLNEYFGNRAKVRWTFEPACAEAGKKPKSGNKMELLEVPITKNMANKTNNIALLLFLVFISGCLQDTRTEEDESESKEPVEVLETIENTSDPQMADSMAMAHALEGEKYNIGISELKRSLYLAGQTVEALEIRVKELEKKLVEMDSNTSESVQADEKKEAPLTHDEASIREMVRDFRNEMNDIYKDRDPENVLQYFLPSFSTTQVTIGIDNKAQIARFSDVDFKSYLKEQMRKKGISIEMESIAFLDAEFKGNICNVTFKSSAKVYKDNKHIINKSILSTITARKDDKWKIGNYSWVTIDYEVK